MSYFDPLPWDTPKFEDGNTDDLYDPEAESERRYFEQWENINDIRFGSDSEWEPPDPQDDPYDAYEYEVDDDGEIIPNQQVYLDRGGEFFGAPVDRNPERERWGNE